MFTFTAIQIFVFTISILRDILTSFLQVSLFQVGISIMMIYFVFHLIKRLGGGVLK